MAQDGLVTDRTEVGQAVAAVGEHHRQIADHAATVVAVGALLQRGELAGERPSEAAPVGDLRPQRAAGVIDRSISVHHDIDGDPAQIVRETGAAPVGGAAEPSA